MPVGRPSSYSDETADAICERLVDGQSLRSICLADDMPQVSTVIKWLSNPDYADFSHKYARAREAQADVMDAKILDVADACVPETAQADRVKIMAYQWRAAKLKPKVYGDKVDVTSGGDKVGIIDRFERYRERTDG